MEESPNDHKNKWLVVVTNDGQLFNSTSYIQTNASDYTPSNAESGSEVFQKIAVFWCINTCSKIMDNRLLRRHGWDAVRSRCCSMIIWCGEWYGRFRVVLVEARRYVLSRTWFSIVHWTAGERCSSPLSLFSPLEFILTGFFLGCSLVNLFFVLHVPIIFVRRAPFACYSFSYCMRFFLVLYCTVQSVLHCGLTCHYFR